MSVSITSNDWWKLFFNWAIVVSTFDACTFCFLFAIIVICVRDIVLLYGGVLDFCVLVLVLCAGAVVFIIGLCLFFLFLCLATVECSTLGTTGVDIVDNCWVGCVIDIV